MKWKPEYTVLCIITGLLIAITVMAVVWSRHECPTPDYKQIERKYELQIDSLETNIQQNEKQKYIDSVTIWNSTRKYRDSLRAIYNPV